MKLHFSYLDGQLTSFLTLLDNGPCHKRLPFSMRREQCCTMPPFLFSQRAPGARLDCFLFPSAVICGKLVYSREFLLKSFVPGDFLTFICFYAAEVKESHVVSFLFFSPFKKNRKKIIFLAKSGQTPRQLHFQQRSKREK